MLEHILLALIVTRLTFMVTYERGPGELFRKVRQTMSEIPWLYEGITCAWCVSFWLGIIISYLHWKDVLPGLAYSCVTIIITGVLYGQTES